MTNNTLLLIGSGIVGFFINRIITDEVSASFFFAVAVVISLYDPITRKIKALPRLPENAFNLVIGFLFGFFISKVIIMFPMVIGG